MTSVGGSGEVGSQNGYCINNGNEIIIKIRKQTDVIESFAERNFEKVRSFVQTLVLVLTPLLPTELPKQ